MEGEREGDEGCGRERWKVRMWGTWEGMLEGEEVGGRGCGKEGRKVKGRGL